MMTWTLCLTLVAAAVSVVAGGCPFRFKAHGDKCYWVSSAVSLYKDAVHECTRLHDGATMITIHDAEENALLAQEVLAHRTSWIGLSRANSSAPWTWVDGSPYDFSLWYMDDPDYVGGDCALINYYDGISGLWAGLDCSEKYEYYACQVAAT
ncbi:Lectin BRA-3 [Amphibalanus amphitrite]|uniref:Lectin BRA-3 n=1 Tax=Amphibalanus amphitrite TaxID=1232801 RepID=A0A6A4X1E0_AMPAM|nr:Lectin BRA-3 [Amphibalanus amphitrite]